MEHTLNLHYDGALRFSVCRSILNDKTGLPAEQSVHFAVTMSDIKNSRLKGKDLYHDSSAHKIGFK